MWSTIIICNNITIFTNPYQVRTSYITIFINPYQVRTSWCKEEKVILFENRFARWIGINHMIVWIIRDEDNIF